MSDTTTFAAAMSANEAARDHFTSLPANLESVDPAAFEAETAKLFEALRVADHAVPNTWAEFVRLLDHMCDGGACNIDGDNAERLLIHARRILAAEGR
ncbi:hypothetical protein [Sphingomonas beigongshangi]|uniref:hypothetical protein n=1 Tax=Sphingomonas beigongshangi TaxID=2782540 RepID=UPI00193B0386|nr:hypothetical protein [Sphingomonas beigongshangi]